jgi:hypothetical protein
VARFRSLVVPLIAAGLAVHLLAMTGTAIAVFTADPDSSVVCTCAHGPDHGACPMHGTSKDSARCRLQSARNDLGAALLSLLGPVALPVAVQIATVDTSSPDPVAGAPALPSDWIVPPDSPPPRT